MGEIIKVNNEKFKSVYVSYNFTLKLDKKEIAPSVISCFTLSKGCTKYKSLKEIEIYLSSLYGANFDIDVQKIGDLFNFEFKIEFVNKKFLPNKEDLSKKCLEFLYEIIYRPIIENGKLSEEIFEKERLNVISLIEKRKDEKIKYAISKAEQLMCKDTAAGNYVYGDLDTARDVKIDDVTEAYSNIINNSLITVIISGNLNSYDNIEVLVKDIFNEKLNNNINKEEIVKHLNDENKYDENVNEEIEKMDTVQSVICLGMKPSINNFFVANVYNAVLGGSPASKLFQNVREKESLAYTTRSRYYRFKDMFIIYAGIEAKNYNKAKEVILKQLEDIKEGNITDIEMKAAKESIIHDIREWQDSKAALEKYKYINYIESNNITINDMLEKIDEVTKDMVVDYAKSINVKLIYMLGGDKDE